jgi:hypothetical protein
MEMETRETDDMDLLKDITQGLRGSGETRRNDRGRASESSRRDRDRRSSTESGDDPASADGNESVESNDESRADEHVCSFCEAEFDASRGVCPDCDAEIIFRGER